MKTPCSLFLILVFPTFCIAEPQSPSDSIVEIRDIAGSREITQKHEFTSVRYDTGNVINYNIPLKSGNLKASEVDPGKGFGFGMNDISISFNPSSESSRRAVYTVQIGSVIHWDIDGDGIFDARSKEGKQEFWHDDSWLEAVKGRSNLSRGVASTPNGDIYEFHSGKWKFVRDKNTWVRPRVYGEDES